MICLCQVFTWIIAIIYLSYDIKALVYLFLIGNIIQALVFFIYWFARNYKLKDGKHKSISADNAPQWMPECIRGSKQLPSDGRAQGGQTADLFSIATQNGVLGAPPSPMIRASGHHHNGHLGSHQGLNQAGSLQQLSVGTPTQTPHLTYQTPPPGIAHHQQKRNYLSHFILSLIFEHNLIFSFEYLLQI